MANRHFTSASDAASFMIKMLRSDYFQDFSQEDRINDPDGLYGYEAERTDTDDEGNECYAWDDREREALSLFAEATPAERARCFELWG